MARGNVDAEDVLDVLGVEGRCRITLSDETSLMNEHDMRADTPRHIQIVQGHDDCFAVFGELLSSPRLPSGLQ